MSWITLDDEIAAILLRDRPRRAAGPGEPHRAESGDERGVAEDARPSPAPPDRAPDAAVPAEVRLRCELVDTLLVAASGCCPTSSMPPATRSARDARSRVPGPARADAGRMNRPASKRVTEGTRTPGLRDHNPTL